MGSMKEWNSESSLSLLLLLLALYMMDPLYMDLDMEPMKLLGMLPLLLPGLDV